MAQPTLLEQFFNMFSNPNTTQQSGSPRPSVTEQAQRYRTNTTASPTGSRAVTRDETGRVQSSFRPDLPQAVRDRLNQGEKILRERSGASPVPKPYPPIQRYDVQPGLSENTPGMSEFVDVYTPFPLPLPAGSPAQSEFIDTNNPLPRFAAGNFSNNTAGEEINADNIAISQLRSSAKEPGAGAANENTASLLNGLKYGGDLAQSQKQEGLINEASDAISGLLGNVDFKGLFRVLARPEFVAPMGPGQTPLTNFVNAAAADRTAQTATRALQQEAGLEGFKAETDRLKALMPDPSKMPKLTGEVNKLYDQLASSKSMAEIGDKIRVSLDKSVAATGGPGVAAEGLRAVAAIFGANIEVEIDDINLRTAELKRMILEGKVFGREANKQELEILSKLVQGPGFTKNKSQILNALESLTKQAEKRSFNVTNRLQAFGMPTDFTNKRPSNTGFVRNQ